MSKQLPPAIYLFLENLTGTLDAAWNTVKAHKDGEPIEAVERLLVVAERAWENTEKHLRESAAVLAQSEKLGEAQWTDEVIGQVREFFGAVVVLTVPQPDVSDPYYFGKVRSNCWELASKLSQRLKQWATAVKVIERLGGYQPQKSKQNGPTPRKASANMRMADKVQNDPEAMGWNTTQWQRYLKCKSRSTITDTATWNHLENYRLAAKVDKQTSQRRNRRKIEK